MDFVLAQKYTWNRDANIYNILSEVLSGSLLTSKTDVYSNCDAVIYNGFALANWFVNAMNKATSHSLYFLT